ncbi:hypothetical protein V6N13_050421 [Hibiscus sabdariffa]|uniref:Ubiquitin-like protease family profile domain-containing protein n=1 Tax=Hibiscus sabdariffa TaxID=183260 RepID=A0ABR2AX67_9ROSI
MASSLALGFLLAGAKAVEDGDLKSADWLLRRVINVADKELAEYQSRVVKYFAEALVRRAYGLRPPSSYYTLPVNRGMSYYYDSYYINSAIRNAITYALPLMGKKRFHLVDFSLPYSLHGRSVLNTLPSSYDDPLSVRVSLILSPLLKEFVNIEHETASFTEEAKEFDTKLEDELKVVYASSLGEVGESDLDFKREDETTMVFYNLKLNKLLKDSKAMKRELVRLREINPALVFMLEFYVNHNDDQFNFFTYLEDSFQYYSNIIEDFWDPFYGESHSESQWIHNIETYEDKDLITAHKTLTEWQNIFFMGGLRQVPLVGHIQTGEIMREENGCLLLGWKQRPTFFLSAWKSEVEDEHLDCNLTGHELGAGFDSNSIFDSTIPSLQPLQPFSEGLTLNRLAAFAEMHDILKDLCHKYNIPLALAWDSRVIDTSENISYPYKNRTLLIQSNYCYVKDLKSYKFMEAYAKSRPIHEGSQSIAGKALESRSGRYFEPSIRNVRMGDDIFLTRTESYGIDAAVAICLRNCYTNNEVYVVEFCWESENLECSEVDIFDELKSMKKKFVTVNYQDTEVGFQEKVISNIRRVEEARDVDAVEINGLNHQGGAKLNSTIQLSGTKYRKSRSKVWMDFDKFEVDGKPVAKCKHCSKEFSGSSKSGTTHLKNHLDRCPTKKKQNQERKLTCPIDTNERSSTFDQEKSCLDFAKLIIKNPCLLDITDQELFKSFVTGVLPMFEFPSKDICLSNIYRIYKEEKEKLLLYFDRLACKFNLTVNFWEDSRGNKTYCCLIAHFIDDDWKLKRKFLSVKTLDHINHTKAVGGIIRSSIAKWNIGKKICSITVDNFSLDDDMVQQIKETCLSDQDSLYSAHWFINYTLLEDGLREIDDILFKLKKSIEYVSETTLGKLKFQEAVDKMRLQDAKSLDDVSFRLDSDFDILDSALGSREIFCQLEQIDVNFKLNPSMQEWEKAVALHSCLKCFDDVKGTQDLYFPKLCDIYMRFLQLEKRNNPIITLMKSKFDHYWSLCNSTLALATVLDPRLNFRFLQISYNLIYGHDSKMQLNKFRKVLTDVYTEYANEGRNLTKSASNMDDSNCSTPDTATVCILDYFSKIVSEGNFNEEISSKSELDCYLDEPLLPFGGAFDVLGWWHVKSQTFPTLARMARDLLAMPISVFAPCSDFSAVISNPAYSSLNTVSIEAFVCSQNWLEIPKENDGKNHEPAQNTEKRKRKMEDINVIKVTKTLNHDKANISIDTAKDSNKDDGSPSLYSWSMPQNSSSEFVDEKAEFVRASNVHLELRLLQSSEPNYGRDINGLFEIPDDYSSFGNNQFEMSQSSSSESDDETPLYQQGSWCKEDVRAYLVSGFTYKENKRLDKWQRNELNGKLIGRDKEFRLPDEKLAPLLMASHGNETRKEYYIDDSVVNTFFKLLKKRSERYPGAYISHYSFDSQIATYLIDGSRSEQEVLSWFKAEKLAGVHKLFLPLCSSSHWLLFYVDTKEKKILWLDSNPSTRITSNNVKKQTILQWFTTFLLPEFGYNDANEWPFVMRTDIPVQENLVDCGVFVMKYGDCLTHGDLFPFTQDDMVHFRRRIFLDVYRGRLHTKK